MEIEEKNLKKEFWKYIIPSLVAQIVFTLYSVVDALMVARGVSPQALAGVNTASPFLTILWALAITFAVGASTMIARLMGEKQSENADEVFSQTIAVLVALSVVIFIASFAGAGWLADIFGATEHTREYVITYIRTIAPFSVFFMVAYSFELLMPIDGHPKLASLVVSTCVVVNCVLDYLFIFIFKWGVFGAAFATGIAQLVNSTLFVAHFLSKKSNIRFKKFKLDLKVVGQEIWRGIPTGIAEFSPGIIVIIFINYIGKYIGENGVIAYSATNYVGTLLIIVAVAFAQGGQPLISFFNGAKRADLIKRVLRMELEYAFIAAVLVFTLVYMTAPWIVSFFMPNESSAMIEYSIHAFRLFITFTLINVFNVVLGQLPTALEKPVTATVLTVLRCTVFLVSGIVIMLKLIGPDGIWLGLTAAEALTLITVLILFKINKGYLGHIQDSEVESK